MDRAKKPVLFFHPGFVAEAFVPVLEEPALVERYRLIHYHRRGYGESARAAGPLTLSAQAADARALLEGLGIERAHAVGHSYGADVALQLALDSPKLVGSLTLIEPAVPAALADPGVGSFFMRTVQPAFARYAAGDKAGAVDTWLAGAFGPGYVGTLERALPGVRQQLALDADAAFQVEAPALQGWAFTPAEAARIRQPVLSIYHREPRWPGFEKPHALLRAWLPQTQAACLDGVTHLMQIANPRGVAEVVAGFLARAPIPVPA